MAFTKPDPTALIQGRRQDRQEALEQQLAVLYDYLDRLFPDPTDPTHTPPPDREVERVVNVFANFTQLVDDPAFTHAVSALGDPDVLDFLNQFGVSWTMDQGVPVRLQNGQPAIRGAGRQQGHQNQQNQQQGQPASAPAPANPLPPATPPAAPATPAQPANTGTTVHVPSAPVPAAPATPAQPAKKSRWGGGKKSAPAPAAPATPAPASPTP